MCPRCSGRSLQVLCVRVCVCVCVCVCARSVMSSFAILWIVACRAPLSMEFPGKNSGVGCHFLLQGIFLTQGLNPHLLCHLNSLPVTVLALSYLLNCLKIDQGKGMSSLQQEDGFLQEVGGP